VDEFFEVTSEAMLAMYAHAATTTSDFLREDVETAVDVHQYRLFGREGQAIDRRWHRKDDTGLDGPRPWLNLRRATRGNNFAADLGDA